MFPLKTNNCSLFKCRIPLSPSYILYLCCVVFRFLSPPPLPSSPSNLTHIPVGLSRMKYSSSGSYINVSNYACPPLRVVTQIGNKILYIISYILYHGCITSLTNSKWNLQWPKAGYLMTKTKLNSPMSVSL